MRFSAVSSILGLSLLALGCPADDGSGDDGVGGTQADGGGTEGTSTTATSTSAGTATEGVDETTAGPPPSDMIPARGIQISSVEANQGVGVLIGDNGGWVGPADRVARLLQGRVTLVRGFWQLDADFEPREIEAHLILEWPDGTVERRIDTKLVDGETFIGDPDRVFWWGIEGELTVPGITYAIELFETDPSYADGAPDTPPFFPSTEGTPQLIGIEDSYQLIKIVVVPFAYNDGAGCDSLPDTSESTMQLFHDLMLMQNPVDQVQLEIHDPIPWDRPGGTSYGEMNIFMSELRFDEGALPETYYYGLIDFCMYPDNNVVGQALGIPTDPTSMNSASQRVSSGYSNTPDLAAETFVHEVGHSAGRRHVACNGMEAGTNPSYPFPGGDVGEWGFGIVDFSWRHPTVHKDYMTYCSPTWVGTWGWNKIQPVIETLSMWDADYPGNNVSEPENPYNGSLLMGALLDDGTERWITVPGSLTGYEVASDTEIVFERADGATIRQPAVAQMMPDGDELLYLAPLPEAFENVTTVRRVSAGRVSPIDRASIGEHHHQRTVDRTKARR